MALYKTGINPSQMAQSAMNAATQAAASQTKQTTTKVKKEGNVWDDIYKGAAAVAAVGRGVNSLVDAAGSAWDMYDKYKLRDAYDDVSKAFGQGGFESIQNNPDMQDYWHTQAVGQFVKDRAGTEKGRLEMLKSMDAAADKQYQDWRVQAAYAEDAFKSGNMQRFMPAMQRLSEITPMPHRLVPTRDGNFKVLFRSDKHYGEFVETGQILTPQQTVDMMRSVRDGETYVLKGIDGKLHPTNPFYNSVAARNWWGTVMGNSENSLDPNKQRVCYKNGKPYAVAVLQNRVDDYMKRGQYKVFALSDGRSLGIADGVPGLLQMGLSPFTPKKEKGSGNGGTGQTADTFKLTDGDRSALRRACTVMDPNSGEERVDHGKVAALENFMQRNGLSADAALAAFDENVAIAMQQGAPNRQVAEKAVLDMVRGRAPVQRNSGNQAGGSAHAGGQQGVFHGLGERIRKATDGSQSDQGGSDYSAPEVWSGRFAPRGNLSSADNQLGGDGARNAFRRQEEARETDARLNDAMSGYDERNYGSGALSRLGTDNDDAYFSERFKEQRMKEERKRYPMRPISPLFRLGE